MINKSEIDGGNGFDFGKVSVDYGKFRDIYPKEFYEKIADLGLCTIGQRVLDIGTGTGVLPRNMYSFGADFVGADISENQIKEAVALSKKAGMKIDFIVSSAENVDYPDGYFDSVTALQCFMYFDKAVVIEKIHRLLSADGHFAIMFMAWLPDESEIAKMSEKIILKYNPFWTGANMKRVLPEVPTEINGYFDVESVEGFGLNLTFTRESWNGRIMTCRGIGASSLSDKTISCFEKEHMEYLSTVPEKFEIPHYATIIKLKKI